MSEAMKQTIDNAAGKPEYDFNIIIDGQSVGCYEGELLLAVALRNGIDIPHLCYEGDLLRYGACSLCVVQKEGDKRLVRSCCAAVSKDMNILTNTPQVQHSRKMALELIMADHTGDCKGPCELACPAHTDVQGYLKQISLGNYSEAVRIIKQAIPIPASIGRVCPHPCEQDCRRNLVEAPLSIAYLKAFAADADAASSTPFVPEVAANSGKKVAIVGGGPAGLSAAYYLRLAGHSVCVFDAMPEMGGMLRYGIPEYRLPAAVLGREVEAIAELGVEMRCGVRLGVDVTLEELRGEYDAVLLAVGAWKAAGLRCPGEELDGVLGGIDFLRDVTCGNAPDFSGKSVVVVGGGNTAMDACRSAVRCGADQVSVVYRRTRAEAPADDCEIEDAIEEGVDFRFLCSPVEVLGESGQVRAVKLQAMELGEPDASGRRRPVPIEGAFEELPVDVVISAIGQKCVLDGMEAVGATDWGTIAANPRNFATTLPGVFAAGDVTNNGPGIAIEAIAEANKAAEAIDAYLRSGSCEGVNAWDPYWSKRQISAEDLADREKKPRAKMPVLAPEVRRGNFDEVILGFSEEAARAEAARCLECGCHDFHDCSLIRYANMQPIDPARLAGSKHEAYKEQKLQIIERDQGKCILCNVCVRSCAETAEQYLLGLVNRGSRTYIAPQLNGKDPTRVCADCHLCADRCPTGALRLL